MWADYRRQGTERDLTFSAGYQRGKALASAQKQFCESKIYLVLKALFTALTTTLLLSACTSPPDKISDPFDLGKSGGYLTDAKSRVIIAQEPSIASRPGSIFPRRLTCIEPHPDVATSIANSFGVGLSLFAKGSASISGDQATGLAQIAQRTASIQTLQRLMFRACEGYSNGAITGTSYSLLLSEINKTMVTLILSETAGGRFGAQGAHLGGESSSKADAKVVSLEDALKNLLDDTQKVEETTVGTNDAIKDQNLASNAANEASKENPGATPTVVAETKNTEQQSDKAVDAAKALKRSASAVTEAAAKITSASGTGAISSKPDAAIAGILEKMQANFLSSGDSQKIVEACLVELSLGSQSGDLNLSSPPAAGNAKNFSFIENNVGPSQKPLDQLQKAASVAIQKYLEGGSNKQIDDAHDLVYKLHSLNRKSGLFIFCAQNLVPYLELTEKNRTTLRSGELALKTEMVKAAKAIAATKTDANIARYVLCNTLDDPNNKKECLEMLKKVERTADQNPEQPNPQPKPAPKDTFAEVMSLTQQEQTIMFGQFAKFKKAAADFLGAKITVDTPGSPEAAKVKAAGQEEVLKALTNDLSTLGKLKGKTDQTVTDLQAKAAALEGKKDELALWSSEYNSRLAQAKAEPDPNQKKKLEAERDIAKANIVKRRSEIKTIREEMSKQSLNMIDLENAIKTHNAAVAEFLKKVT